MKSLVIKGTYAADGSSLRIEQSSSFSEWQNWIEKKEKEWDFVLVMGNMARRFEGQRVAELDVARWIHDHSDQPVFTIHERRLERVV
ncbi:MAG: hypothetical protein IPM37_03240 [Hahellaceae bacterium]|nr:hypothetical protein [Hahellaceae bacterium]